MPTKKRPAASKPPTKTATNGAELERTVAERLNAASARLRLEVALERLSKIEARLGSSEDHAARLVGIECVLSAQNVIIGHLRSDLESRTVRGGFFGRLRWLLVGQ